MFSLLPRCHGECASQKNTPAPIDGDLLVYANSLP